MCAVSLRAGCGPSLPIAPGQELTGQLAAERGALRGRGRTGGWDRAFYENWEAGARNGETPGGRGRTGDLKPNFGPILG